MSAQGVVAAMVSGLQIINALRRMMDPAGGDHALGSILASGVRGELTDEQVEAALLERMRAKGDEVMTEWRDEAPKV